jgi:hypothetical protein
MNTFRHVSTSLRLLVASILCCAAASSHAQVAQTLYAQPASPAWRDNYTGGSGCEFEVGSTNVVVSHLGFFSTNNVTGLATNHYVGIYGATSGTPLLAQVVVPAGTSAYYASNFYWVQLTPPILLASNTSYYVAAMPYIGDGDFWGDTFNATFNPWFIGTNAASNQKTAYGLGNSDWPVLGFSTFGTNSTYCVEGMAYMQVGPAVVGLQQTNVTVSAGQTLSVLGFASGQAPISYQWYSAPNTPLAGQTNASLIIADVTTNDNGTYFLIASNALSQQQSSNVTVLVTSFPVTITQEPSNTTVYANYPVTFSLAGSGSPPVTYQWFRDGVAIPGATATNYSFTPSFTNNGDIYTAVASNFTSKTSYTATTTNAVLTVLYNVALPQQFLHGYNNKLSDNNYGGQQGGQFTTGANSVLVTHLGYYAWPPNTTTNGSVITCVLTNSSHYIGLYNGAGTELLGSALVPQGTNPVLNGYMWAPLNPPLVLSNNTEYLLDAQTTTDGDPWGNTYVIPDLNPYYATSCDAIYGGNPWGTTPYPGGEYGGQMYSAPNMAILASPTPAAYALPEAGITTNAGFNETLTAFVDGQAPLTVQWFKEPGVPLAGQTNLTLALTNITVAESGSYYIVASNYITGSNAQSQDVSVTVNPDVAPYIVQDITPLSPAIVQGSSVTFSAIFNGSPSFTYGWQFDGNPVTNSAHISGANGNALTINDVQNSDAGTYQLWVTNAEGVNVTSASVLSVVPVVPFDNGLGFSDQGTSLGWAATNALDLTLGGRSESNSAFCLSPVYIGAFDASFTYQCTGGGILADGLTFCIQNDPRGSAALGADGGQLGVGSPFAIEPSVELEFNVYSNNDIGGVGISFDTNGAIGPVVQPTNVLIDSGDLIAVELHYANGLATVTLTDTVSNTVFSMSTNLNIPAVLGTNVAYVGFTAADGGDGSIQEVTDFDFVSLPQLSAQSSGGNLVLSWPAPIGDYALEQNDNLESTNWTPVTAPVEYTNNMLELVVPPSGVASFYKLVVTNAPGF